MDPSYERERELLHYMGVFRRHGKGFMIKYGIRGPKKATT
jgi:hypothetical protein